MRKYDYIVAGAGAAGLSLLVHLIRSGQFSDKTILLVDRAPKMTNDRTWCFWEQGEGPFEEIVHKRWSSLWFHEPVPEGFSGDHTPSGTGSSLHDVLPYHYKLIRGIDFYRYCFDLIVRQPNITIEYGEAGACISGSTGTYLVLNGERVEAEYIFNSIDPGEWRAPGKITLLQHFKGWLVRSQSPVFDPAEATLMDFRPSQREGTVFVYVMPFTEHEALVEYTLFSAALLHDADYETALKDYCRNTLGLLDYAILEREFGVIPMTDHFFPRHAGNIVHIGTAGGQTKASSGYTFKFIQKNSRAIADALIKTGKPFVTQPLLQKRFHWYDRTLLHILANRQLRGADVFATMMRSNPMRSVFKFLDDETSIGEEMRIIRKLPWKVFLQAAFKKL